MNGGFERAGKGRNCCGVAAQKTGGNAKHEKDLKKGITKRHRAGLMPQKQPAWQLCDVPKM